MGWLVMIALVRAAGLRAQANALAGASLPVTDANLIPSNLRGYVSVALSLGLLAKDGAAFNPNRAMTRAELAARDGSSDAVGYSIKAKAACKRVGSPSR